MSTPTVQEIRDVMEGYGVTSAVLSDNWIEKRRDRFVIPHVETICRQSFRSVKTATEYHSGVARNILILDRRPIIALTSIQYVIGEDGNEFIDLNMIEVVNDEGILKSKTNYNEIFLSPVFATGEYNILVTYTYGFTDMPDDVNEAVIYLCAEQALGLIGARTGGGSLGVQAHNRGYGSRGKYQDIRNDLARQAHALLANYMTSVVGS